MVNLRQNFYSVGEFEFIDGIRRSFAGIDSHGIEGIGDDCAVIPVGADSSLVMTCDLLTEGVHFTTDKMSPEDIGYKSLAVNLSDVAAMGAEPIATLLSLALPPTFRGRSAERFMNGYRELSERWGVMLIGGDTTSSTSGLTVNVTAVGRARNTNLKRRSSATAGQVVVVTGPLGISSQGLDDVLAGRSDTAAAKCHLRPEPRIRQGVWFGTRAEVGAMMDLSDGLATDLPHILDLSGVSATIDVSTLPAPYGITRAVCGGEDYELLLTVDESRFERMASEYKAEFGSELYRIGRIIEGSSRVVQWFDGESRMDVDWKGYTHF